MPNSDKVMPIAIHLPQFHPIKENDEWWGKGFTEWTNVAKAKPLFKEHYQPHLPADLGYYDLRLEEARLAQEALAKEYGIYGFCYYHYWFNGKRLLHEPLDRKLKNPKEDFPFMLCWANENWTRRWDGQENEVLIKQDYNLSDFKEHIEFLCENYFSDARYIKIGGKPFVIIYKPHLIANLGELLSIWRQITLSYGFPGIVVGYMNQGSDFSLLKGFDYAIDFQPNFDVVPSQIFPSFKEKLKKILNISESAFYKHKIVDYKSYVKQVKKCDYHPKIIPGITPGWDNSARKQRNGFIFSNVDPNIYQDWLEYLKANFISEQPFIFINAWNEWAEGNHLEPCKKWGLSFLDATQKALK